MSPDELAQYGIEVSEDGPVMIPLDKAMAAAKSILAGAKTIYAVRDGLEVMRQGLAVETSELKKRREEGPGLVVASIGGQGGGNTTSPLTPSDASPEVG